MSFRVDYTKKDSLPATIPVFPLNNVLLLPDGDLPLNIFEKRYLDMIDDALRTHRIIGMTQPCNNPEKCGDKSYNQLYKTGCAGRITSFSETDDGRYLINLTGLCRFDIENELDTMKGYRQFKVDWTGFPQDLESQDAFFKNREAVMSCLKQYFEKQGMICDWDLVEDTADQRLITLLSMICPFSAEEKQMLLEAKNPCARADLLFSLLEMEATLDCFMEKDQSKH